MNRRAFLGAAAGAVGFAATGLVGCRTQQDPTISEEPEAPAVEPTAAEIAEAVAQDNDLPTLNWPLATSWPLALDTIFGTVQLFAEYVGAMTGGRFTITPRAAGELAPPLEVLNVVEQGAVPIGHTASYYYIGRTPAMAFGTSLPFGLTARQQNAWLYHGGGLELLQDFYRERFNIIQFPAGNTGAQMGGWWNREIEQPADLQGLKMRVTGLGGQVLSRMGVTVQVLAGGEIFQALQTGAIDAAEWVGPYDDEKLGLNDAAQYYYAPGWWEPGPTVEVQINLNEWNNLPELYQEVIKLAAYQANIEMLARYDALNGQAMQRLIDGGTQVRTFSAEIMQAAREESFTIFDEFSQSDADFHAIFEQWNAFRENVQSWHSLIETTYNSFIASQI